MSYMFIHDGLVHRRFPVGPIADVPYLKRVAIAHKLHHSEKYDGVPWGLFLGPQARSYVSGLQEDCRRLTAATVICQELKRLSMVDHSWLCDTRSTQDGSCFHRPC